MSRIRVVIADDHPLIAMGIQELLEPDMTVVIEAQVHTPTALVAQLEQSRPDVVITDYNMPDDERYGDGFQFICHLLRRFPEVKFLVLTMISNPSIIDALYKAGVCGVILKKHPITEVLRALRATCSGLTYYPLDFSSRAADGGNAAQHRIQTLSPKEFEVLRLFAQGKSVSEVAEHLHRSIKTVSAQKSTAMRKLNVDNNQDLISFCIQHDVFT